MQSKLQIANGNHRGGGGTGSRGAETRMGGIIGKGGTYNIGMGLGWVYLKTVRPRAPDCRPERIGTTSGRVSPGIHAGAHIRTKQLYLFAYEQSRSTDHCT